MCNTHGDWVSNNGQIVYPVATLHNKLRNNFVNTARLIVIISLGRFLVLFLSKNRNHTQKIRTRYIYWRRKKSLREETPRKKVYAKKREKNDQIGTSQDDGWSFWCVFDSRPLNLNYVLATLWGLRHLPNVFLIFVAIIIDLRPVYTGRVCSSAAIIVLSEQTVVLWWSVNS